MPSRPLVSLALAVLLSVTGGLAAPLPGQESEPVRLQVQGDGGLSLSVGDLLADPALVRALHSGLPLRIVVEVELWKDGFFDSQRGESEWRATVIHEPLEERYRIVGGDGDEASVLVDSLGHVGRTLQERFRPELGPEEAGTYYYLGEVVVETLSLSDLEELQQWLRGDLAAAVAGERAVEDAVGSGMRRLMVRMLGLPARRQRLRSPSFSFGGG